MLPLGFQVPLQAGPLFFELRPRPPEHFLLIFEIADQGFAIGHLLLEIRLTLLQGRRPLIEFAFQLPGRLLDLPALLFEHVPLPGDLVLPLIEFREMLLKMLRDPAGFDEEFVLFAEHLLSARNSAGPV
jgi:hypothetical protein